jgi:hypothetical protein
MRASSVNHKHTMISAMTRGCRSGRSRNARPRVRARARTRQICRMMSGREKCSGLSPCHTPSDVAFIGAHSASPPPPPIICLPRSGRRRRARSGTNQTLCAPIICLPRSDRRRRARSGTNQQEEEVHATATRKAGRPRFSEELSERASTGVVV